MRNSFAREKIGVGEEPAWVWASMTGWRAEQTAAMRVEYWVGRMATHWAEKTAD